LLQFLKNQSPDALLQAKLKPKDPADPKTWLAPPHPFDPAHAPNSGHQPRASKTPGTGLVLDITT